eukprot:PhM_4_TR12045/c0_g1_i1/m.53389
MSYNPTVVQRRPEDENSDLSDEDEVAPVTRASQARDLVISLLIISFSAWLVHKFDLLDVMMNNPKVWRPGLYVCYGCWSGFAAIGFYLTFVVSKSHPNFEETHKEYIWVATGLMTAGSVCWMLALWPVFHIWTFVLGIAIMFGCLRLLTIVPAKQKKD